MAYVSVLAIVDRMAEEKQLVVGVVAAEDGQLVPWFRLHVPSPGFPLKECSLQRGKTDKGRVARLPRVHHDSHVRLTVPVPI